LNDRVGVLAEIVMEATSADARVVTDLERLQLTFHVNDHATAVFRATRGIPGGVPRASAR
jgi:hypothetical protein